jgi:spore germination protein
VSLPLAPKTGREQRGLLYEGMDYQLLGQNADAVFLMTYEWGHTYGPPMAVAPLNKVNSGYCTMRQPRDLIFPIGRETFRILFGLRM